MATMAEISAAINLIDTKKQNLHKSFLHLQSQTPSSFNLPLNWSDLDSYFTTVQSSLQSKFNLLQTFPPSINPTKTPDRPELKSFCQNSDGLGLRQFITLALDHQSILSELPDAYRCAPDAPSMVLDAIVGFYTSGCKGNELRLFRSACLIMLEGLIRVNPVITVLVKNKATEMAVQWNQKRCSGPGVAKAKEQKAIGFLLLVGAYGLVDRFNIDDIIDSFLVVATDRQTVDLCRRIIPENNINDMIQKLIDNDMHISAVNFSIDLQKSDKFPPVGLLEDRKLRSLRVIEEARANVKDLHACNDLIIEEINVLKSIIECIDENHLQAEYPKDSVVELVNKLENEVESNKQTLVNDPPIRKQPTRAVVLKTQLQSKSKMSKRSKRPRLNKSQPTTESVAVTAVQDVKLVQESKSQKTDLSSTLGWGPTGSNGVRAGESHSLPLGPGPTDSNGVRVGEIHSSPLGSGPTGSNGVRVGEIHSSPLNGVRVGESHSSPLGSGPAGSNGVRVGESHSSPLGPGPAGSDGVCVVESYSSPLGPGPAGSNGVRVCEIHSSPLGSGPIGSKGVCVDESHTSPLGLCPTGSNGVRVGETHSSPLGSGPIGSNGVRVGESHSSPLGSGPTGSNASPLGSSPTGSSAPCANPVAGLDGLTGVAGLDGLDGLTGVDTGYDFFVKQSQPPSDSHSNGWLSE